MSCFKKEKLQLFFNWIILPHVKCFVSLLFLIVSLPQALPMLTDNMGVDAKQEKEGQTLDQRKRCDASEDDGQQNVSSLQKRGTVVREKERKTAFKTFMMTSTPLDVSSRSATVPLQNFWDAAQQHPNTARFVLKQGASKITPYVSSLGGRLLKTVTGSSDGKKDKATINAFRAAITEKYPGISWNDIWTHGNSNLGAVQIEACKKALAEHPSVRAPSLSFHDEMPSESIPRDLNADENDFMLNEPVSRKIAEGPVPNEINAHNKIKNAIDAAFPDLRATIKECRRGTLDWSSNIDVKDIKIWDDAWTQLVSLLPITEETKNIAENVMLEIQSQSQQATGTKAIEYLKFFKERFPEHEKYIDAKKALEATICDRFIYDSHAREVWIDAAVQQGSAKAREIMAQQHAQAPHLKNDVPFLQQAGIKICAEVIEAAQKGAQRALSEDPTSFLEKTILPIAKEALLKNKDAIEPNQPIDFTIKNAVKEAFISAMHQVMSEVIVGAVDSSLDVLLPTKHQSVPRRFSQSTGESRSSIPVLNEALPEKERESITSEESDEDSSNSVWKTVKGVDSDSDVESDRGFDFLN